jgi:transcriptional regulator with XRE-family HTH domain
LPISKELVRWRLRKLRYDNADPRTGKPLSQEDAAAQVDVATYRQWQRWEAMHSLPRADKLAAIADHFGFDVGEFSGEDRAGASANTPSVQDLLAEVLTRLDCIEAKIASLDRRGKVHVVKSHRRDGL